MLVIRLARTGKKKQAYFRIVVAEKQRAVGSKFIEILGNYNPHVKELKIDETRLAEYLKNGAQPSNTLAKVLKKEGIKLPEWVNIVDRNRPAKKAPEATEAAPKAEAPAADGEPAESTEEAPVESVAEESKEAEAPAADGEPAESTEEAPAEPKEENTKE